MTDTFDQQGKAFWQWLLDNGATLSDGIAFHDYSAENAGRGVIATRDIAEGEVLFSVPRPLLLSKETSALRDHIPKELDSLTGWSPLILCLMYESQRDDSLWKPYFDVLPKEFHTPMFWTKEDLKELQGSDLPDKIGKEQAETMFHQDIEPIIKGHPDIFDVKTHTLDLFHVCGSLVMAYSFADEARPQQQENKSADDSESGAKKEEVQEQLNNEDGDVSGDSDDDEDDEDEAFESVELAMVPMADMLNHKTGFNNARLFHEAAGLHMKAIKTIRKDEQVYNTYGDLCNADLLRKYGFADEENPNDLVEINGDAVVEACAWRKEGEIDPSLREKKIEFLMEEGVLDDCFVIDGDGEIPPELVSAVHVLRASPPEFAKMEDKQKVPKPKWTREVANDIQKVLEQRLERYPTTLQDDQKMLLESPYSRSSSNESSLSRNKRHALLVRIGEKRTIEAAMSKVQQKFKRLAEPAADIATKHRQDKRKKR
ncbi:hypothetical protein BCR43DRAFT_487807 [Syncephalastrum racemosum]|uniref:Ribosomal lysine N-methyltransferase 4 n=1 Tax=Syncephalastrum racemosum TaxID=13706 RepID=A0A1X2HHR3_SYNRA|nr:hypothetical protein BCR43DRAFT_487807 [Syncephalastrum racemosum]